MNAAAAMLVLVAFLLIVAGGVKLLKRTDLDGVKSILGALVAYVVGGIAYVGISVASVAGAKRKAKLTRSD